MPAGRLTDRITIQTVDRVDVAVVWGRIVSSGDDHFTITIRYRTGLEPNMRIVYGEREFSITAIPYEGRRTAYLDLLVYEHTGITAA